jgi:hypothetical protein
LRRFTRRKKAVSSMIGILFFVIIMLSGLNLLSYNIAQDYSLADAFSANESAAFDKRSEVLQVLDVKIDGQTGALNVTVFNAGSRTIHLVRVWVTNQSSSTPWHRIYDVDYWVNVANLEKNLGSDLGSFDPKSKFVINMISDRGSIFVGRYTQSKWLTSTAQGFGWLTLDWNSYSYTVYIDPPKAEFGPYPAWCVANISSGKRYYQFRGTVINHWDRNVNLLSLSYMIFYQTNGQTQGFFIMDPTSTPKNPVAYTTQTVVPANLQDQQSGGTPVTMRFYANAPGGVSQSNNVLNGGSFAVFVVLFYADASGSVYAQTVPFEASEVTTDASC